MEQIRVSLRRFFTGVRRLTPLIPVFLWIAAVSTYKFTKYYWKRSQKIVEKMAGDYMHEALEDEKTTEYNYSLYQICFAIASFFYLLAWLAQAWLAVEAVRILRSLLP